MKAKRVEIFTWWEHYRATARSVLSRVYCRVSEVRLSRAIPCWTYGRTSASDGCKIQAPQTPNL